MLAVFEAALILQVVEQAAVRAVDALFVVVPGFGHELRLRVLVEVPGAVLVQVPDFGVGAGILIGFDLAGHAPVDQRDALIGHDEIEPLHNARDVFALVGDERPGAAGVVLHGHIRVFSIGVLEAHADVGFVLRPVVVGELPDLGAAVQADPPAADQRNFALLGNLGLQIRPLVGERVGVHRAGAVPVVEVLRHLLAGLGLRPVG